MASYISTDDCMSSEIYSDIQEALFAFTNFRQRSTHNHTEVDAGIPLRNVDVDVRRFAKIYGF